MKITQDIRDYAAEQGLMDEAVVEAGMAEKAAEFRAAGGEIYLAAQRVEEPDEVATGD